METDKCYRFGSRKKWEEMTPLPKPGESLSAAPVFGWQLFAGGWTDTFSSTDAFLMNSDGQRVRLPYLTVARFAACATTIHENSDELVVAILGGWGEEGVESMERYKCSRSDPPTCQKISDGPNMISDRHAFGCGVLQTMEVRYHEDWKFLTHPPNFE